MSAMATSISRSTADSKSDPGGTNQAKIGDLTPFFRRVIASSSNATPSQSAPADSAALATSTIPCP